MIASQMRNTLDKKRFKFTSKIQNFLLNFAGDLFSFFHNFLLKKTYFLAVQVTLCLPHQTLSALFDHMQSIDFESGKASYNADCIQ